ncbi:MAG: hypothetical protein IPQ04_15320 [Saprospiraceae bacterium]|nr:hypothetical protein [Saprospiraceae bacterium]
MTPGHVNPANTGGFYGSYRIGGIYRDQSLSATGEGNQYRTPHIYMDAIFPWGLRKKIGGGIWNQWITRCFWHNRPREKSFPSSAAYHLALGKASRSDLALGIQWGTVSFGVGSRDQAKDLVGCQLELHHRM